MILSSQNSSLWVYERIFESAIVDGMSNAERVERLARTAKIETNEVLKNHILSVQSDSIKQEDGVEKQYDYVVHPGAAVIAPLASDGRYLFIRQFRYPVKQILHEFPAGVIEAGEEPEKTAARELREETGFESKSLTFLFDFHTAPGFSNEKLFLYHAKHLKSSPLIAEDTDEIDLVPMSLDEAIKRHRQGEVFDAKTLLAIYYLKEMS